MIENSSPEWAVVKEIDSWKEDEWCIELEIKINRIVLTPHYVTIKALLLRFKVLHTLLVYMVIFTLPIHWFVYYLLFIPQKKNTDKQADKNTWRICAFLSLSHLKYDSCIEYS